MTERGDRRELARNSRGPVPESPGPQIGRVPVKELSLYGVRGEFPAGDIAIDGPRLRAWTRSARGTSAALTRKGRPR